MEDKQLLQPPSDIKGAVNLDRNSISKTIIVLALVVDEADIGKLVKILKKYMFHMRGVRIVQSLEDANSKRKALLLDPIRFNSKEDVTKLLSTLPAFNEISYDVAEQSIHLSYENWSAEEILKAILPNEVPSVTGFSVVGHVAHLNLKDCHQPYKHVIGQVLIDKHHNIDTVVNKTDSIDNTYRNFQMEVLAGKDDLNVTVKENGCSFHFDFSKVYWNSRLGTEHERIVSEITKDTVVYDVFAGVGPFSVPAAKRGAHVYCNDLNPESFRALQQNLKNNKVKGEYHTYNVDGRSFIKDVVKETLPMHLDSSRPIMFIMNLPALAIDFLDAFCGLLCDNTKSTLAPVVYCYCFSKDPEDSYEEDASRRANAALQSNLVKPDMCRRVRNVAPNKEMICIRIPLSMDVLKQKSSDEQPDTKRFKSME